MRQGDVYQQDSAQRRLLIVEDNKDMRETYLRRVKEFLPDVDIDATDSRDGALDLLRRRTYHAVLLDIMLVEGFRDTGGLQVLDQIKAMNEGTLAVMLSGTQEIGNCIRALRSRICVDYIHKRELNNPSIYINPLREALTEARIPIYGKFGSLTAYLAHPARADGWEYDAMQVLGEGGFALLNDSLLAAFSALVPVLRPTNVSASLDKDVGRSALHGLFWSKALGRAVWIAIWTGTRPPVPPESSEIAPLRAGKVRRASYEVRVVPNLSRDAFVETIED